MESIPYDLQSCLVRPGPNAALKTYADFARATASADIFGPTGQMNYVNNLPQFAVCLADPSRPPNLSEFMAVKGTYLSLFDEVFERHGLDA